jgi:serine/threonine protein kinase
LTEKEIRIVFLQLFNAIKYLHDRKIVHRDLKPENILMPSKEGLRIKVSDFGLSKLLNIDYSTMQTVCGTVLYVAPEVLESNKERSYNRAVDMWSAGVILYVCLCGDLPFSGSRTNEVVEKIKSGIYSMNSPRWNNVSDSAKDLVCGLLTKDSFKRLTVDDALNHPFIKCERSIPPSLNYGMYESIHTSLNYGPREFKQSYETSTSDVFYSCVSQFPETSTDGEELCKRSFITASETIRSYSNIESEISSSDGSF